MTTAERTTASVATPLGDDAWWSNLTDDDPAGREALTRLHELLLRASRHQVWRLRALLPGAGSAEIEDLAHLARAVQNAIATQLTSYQRRVVLALLVEEVPIDVLAERLGSSRNALYKALHDARQRLRHALVDSGHLAAGSERSST